MIFLFVFSDEKDTLFRLRKLLTASSKERRHRRRLLSIQITFIAWLAESMGFLVIFLGTFILGHENNVFNFLMQTITLTIYFIILPSVFLLNDFDVKSEIVESNWYSTILTIFHCNYIHNIDDGEESNQIDDASVVDEQKGNHSNINFDETRGSDSKDR